MHRGVPEHGPWWRLGQQLLLAVVVLAVASALFVLFSLALHGHVNW
jgi:hypothetical protein